MTLPDQSTYQAPPPDERAQDAAEILSLLKPLREHRRLVLWAPLGAGALAVALSFLVRPTFTSATMFMPPQQQQSNAAAALASLGALAGLAGGGVKSSADQYIALMESRTISDRLIDHFNLMQVYDAEFRDDARKMLSERTQITSGKKDGLITVMVEDHDPKQAAAMANQYVEELRRMTSVLAVTEAQQRRMFFERKLQETKEQLTAAQVALQDSGYGSGSLKAEPKAAAEVYAQLRAQLTTAEVRLQTMRGNLASGSPEVQQQTATVMALRERLGALEKSSAAAANGPDYVSKYREFKYQEALFDLLAKQFEVARLDESREGALIQVVDVAAPAERKSKPKRALIGLAAVLLTGLLLPLGLVARGRWKRFAEAGQ